MNGFYLGLAIVLSALAVAFGAPAMMLAPMALVFFPRNAPPRIARAPQVSPHRWRPRTRADLSREHAVR